MVWRSYCDSCGKHIPANDRRRPVARPPLTNRVEMSYDVCRECESKISPLLAECDKQIEQIVLEYDKRLFPYYYENKVFEQL